MSVHLGHLCFKWCDELPCIENSFAENTWSYSEVSLGVRGCQAVLQLLGIMLMGRRESLRLLFPPQILDIISQRSGLNFLLPLVKNSHVKGIASIALAAGLPHGSDVLLQGNLISCLAEKPQQCDLSPETALRSVSIFIVYLDESQFNKMLLSAQFSHH